MTPTRRGFVVTIAAAGAYAPLGPCLARAAVEGALPKDLPAKGLRVTVAANSPWMVNQVALTREGLMFLGLPRYPDHEDTPGVARRNADGTVSAFPGNSWNAWKPGDDGLDAFVYVNSLHIFADDTVWCVDQGRLRPDATPPGTPQPRPGAQKVVQMDARSGEILHVLRFGADILPEGAQLNDLRIFGPHIYLTDSGLGALIVHDLTTGHTLRRLSGRPAVLATPMPVDPTKPQGPHRVPKSDLIEISPDGAWLYWASPTGPFRRIATVFLRDPNLSDDDLAGHVEPVADIALSGGSAMDSLGNLYLSEIATKQITVLSPAGQKAVLAADPDFLGPDNPFLDAGRRLYVPCSQAGQTRLFGNATDLTVKPFKVFAVELPDVLDGIPLGHSLNVPAAVE